MRNVAAFAAGIAVALAIASCCVWLGAEFGLFPVNADARPSSLERWVARTALIAGVERHMTRSTNPVTGNIAVLDGIRIYKANCEVCHGGADGVAGAIGRGLYQRPPQFADRRSQINEIPYDYTAWVIRHGIRFTGMPAFLKTLSHRQVDDVALFLSRMYALTPDQRFAWSGASLRPQLTTLDNAIGGYRQCTFRPRGSKALGYEDETYPTPDGQFLIDRVYDLNQRVSELSVTGARPAGEGYVRVSITNQGTAAIATSPRVTVATVRWTNQFGLSTPQSVTTIDAKPDGTYTYVISHGESGRCSARMEL